MAKQAKNRQKLLVFLSRPFIGAAIAIVTYLLLRVILSSTTNGTQINDFGIVGASALIGLMNSDITKKLRNFFDEIFGINKPIDEEDKIPRKSDEKSLKINKDNRLFKVERDVSLEKDNFSEKRGAIIIGINKYADNNNIPKLLGAENDAKHVYQLLKDQNIGNFNILDNHLLIGENATYAKSPLYQMLKYGFALGFYSFYNDAKHLQAIH